MLRPVGNLPPVIYWRRRIFLLVLPAVLLLLVLVALVRGGKSGAAGTSRSTAPSAGPAVAGSAVSTGSASTGSAVSTGSPATTPGASDATPNATGTTSSAGESTATSSAGASFPARSHSSSVHSSASKSDGATKQGCGESDLRVQAVASSESFSARSGPTFYLQVTNTSKHACREDLADKQVVLTVRAGDVRVWGSHDCKVISGKDKVTLAPDAPVQRGIVWSGRTSAPGCADTRHYVPPGSYELYATLSGRRSAPTTFTVTS